VPSEFFNQLVQARREIPPETPGEEAKPTEIMVNFFPAPYDGLSTCGLCLALVITEYAPTHADWHRQRGG